MTTSRVVHIDAQPDRFRLDTAKTAVIVCDMQNDFGAEGGMFHGLESILRRFRRRWRPRPASSLQRERQG